jgi:triacylglycerol esterase/lipase EstA (alpha/beta hydrolase family)
VAAAALTALLLVASVAWRGLGPTVGGRPGTAPAQDQPGAVLLVPGYGGATAGLGVLARRLRSAGHVASVIRLSGDGTGDLAVQARVLNGYVTRALQAGAPSVDIVGYSAGGVVARLWVQAYGGAGKVRRVVTLGSPHHGATLAAVGAAVLPDACPAACRELTPGSPFLAALAAPVQAPPLWLSLWTRDDATVTPPESARLPGALNVEVQSLCPGARVSHSQLPTDPRVADVVLDALGPGNLSVTRPRDC